VRGCWTGEQDRGKLSYLHCRRRVNRHKGGVISGDQWSPNMAFIGAKYRKGERGRMFYFHLVLEGYRASVCVGEKGSFLRGKNVTKKEEAAACDSLRIWGKRG